jgi:hypothetical protein
MPTKTQKRPGGALIVAIPMSIEEFQTVKDKATKLNYGSVSSYLKWCAVEEDGELDFSGATYHRHGKGGRPESMSVYLKRDMHDLIRTYADKASIPIASYIRCRGLAGPRHGPKFAEDPDFGRRRLGAARLRVMCEELLGIPVHELVDVISHLRRPGTRLGPEGSWSMKSKNKPGLGVYGWSLESKRPVLLGMWPVETLAPDYPKDLPTTLNAIGRDDD